MEDVIGHRLRVLMSLSARPQFTLIHQTQHAAGHKTACFIPDSTAFGVRFSIAGCYRLGKQNDGANEFVVMLNGVGKA